MSQPPGYPQGPPGPLNQGPGWAAGSGPPSGGPGAPGYGYPPGGTHRDSSPGPGWPAAPGSPSHAAGDSGVALIVMLQVAAPVLLVLGLSIPEKNTLGWSSYLAWAIFAVAVSVIPLLALPLAKSTGSAERAWQITVLATAGLIAYWVIVVLPGVTSNTGFLQTMGVGCGCAATWLLSQRHSQRQPRR